MGRSRDVVLLIVVIALSAAVYLIGNGNVALWDRDEPRYAQTSRQMLQSGDWVVPHYLDKARTAKPALIYWCQASAMEIFGDNQFAARFPSAIATIVLLIVLSLVLWRPLGPELTLWTVFIFATSGLTIAAAKMCITDALLLLWITIGQLCLYAIVRGNRTWPIVLILSSAIGLAGLTKGPVILGIQATTLLAMSFLHLLNRQFAPTSRVGAAISTTARVIPNVSSDAKSIESFGSISLKAIVGLLIVVSFILPWVLMVNHRSSGFILAGLKHDVWDRMMTPLEQHVGPPGYYFLTIWITFFPWSLLLPPAIAFAIRHRSDPRVGFALAAVIGPWIMLECVRTKLPHYFLPVFPPLAFLTGRAIVSSIRGEITHLRSRLFVSVAGVWAVMIAVAASGTWIFVRAPLPMPTNAMLALSILGICFGLGVFLAFKMRRIATAAITMGLGTFAFVAVLYIAYLPNADFLRLSPRVADILIAHHVTQPNQVLMMEYMEPSLAFAQGGTIREAGDLGFSKKFEPLFTPWLVLPESIWEKAPAELKNDFTVEGKAFGFAYADHGKWITVIVIHRKASLGN